MRPSALPLTATILLAAAPAAASTQGTFIGPGSATTNVCVGEVGPKTGSGVIHQEATCSRPDVGVASAAATAAPGHIAAGAHADSHNGDSLVAGNSASAQFSDFITFTSTDPNATTAVVAAEVLLEGVMEGSINGGGNFRSLISFAGADFDLREAFSQRGAFDFTNSGFVLEGGPLGAVTDLHMRTGFVAVPLNSPINFLMRLETGAFASGPGAHGLIDFGMHSFKFAPTAFLLQDGVTANAGDWLVDNRFIDPLATPGGGVPEPASWALMIAGFGLAGAALRRRRRFLAA